MRTGEVSTIKIQQHNLMLYNENLFYSHFTITVQYTNWANYKASREWLYVLIMSCMRFRVNLPCSCLNVKELLARNNRNM